MSREATNDRSDSLAYEQANELGLMTVRRSEDVEDLAGNGVLKMVIMQGSCEGVAAEEVVVIDMCLFLRELLFGLLEETDRLAQAYGQRNMNSVANL